MKWLTTPPTLICPLDGWAAHIDDAPLLAWVRDLITEGTPYDTLAGVGLLIRLAPLAEPAPARFERLRRGERHPLLAAVDDWLQSIPDDTWRSIHRALPAIIDQQTDRLISLHDMLVDGQSPGDATWRMSWHHALRERDDLESVRWSLDLAKQPLPDISQLETWGDSIALTTPDLYPTCDDRLNTVAERLGDGWWLDLELISPSIEGVDTEWPHTILDLSASAADAETPPIEMAAHGGLDALLALPINDDVQILQELGHCLIMLEVPSRLLLVRANPRSGIKLTGHRTPELTAVPGAQARYTPIKTQSDYHWEAILHGEGDGVLHLGDDLAMRITWLEA